MSCACRTAALGLFLRSLRPLPTSGAAGASFPQTVNLTQRSTFPRHLLPSWQQQHRNIRSSVARLASDHDAVASLDEYTIERPGGEVVSVENPDKGPSKPSPRPSKPRLRKPRRQSEQGEAQETSKRRERTPKPTGDWEVKRQERKRKPAVDRDTAATAEADTPPQEAVPMEREEWQIQKQALKEKFPDGWNPRKKLSPDALEGIRALNQQFPDVYTTAVLAKRFEVSPEAVRRILKSSWTPSAEEEEDRQQRWFRRGKDVWTRWAELGKRPPARWRREGILPRRRRDEAGRDDNRSQSQGRRMRLAARQRLAESVM